MASKNGKSPIIMYGTLQYQEIFFIEIFIFSRSVLTVLIFEGKGYLQRFPNPVLIHTMSMATLNPPPLKQKGLSELNVIPL